MTSKRRGVTLIIVITVMTLLGAMLTFLTANVAHFYRQSQADRVRLVAQSIADSAVAYARVRSPEWSKSPPTESIDLDVRQIAPENITAHATLQFLTLNDRKVCRISTRAENGPYTIAYETDLAIK